MDFLDGHHLGLWIGTFSVNSDLQVQEKFIIDFRIVMPWYLQPSFESVCFLVQEKKLRIYFR